jgi:uncharacterized protein YydD (DUF2326 family)
MIRRISSDLPSFKNVQFGPGLNILLTDRQAGSTDLQTRNRAGKSSLVQTIHFLLGSRANPDSIFRKSELEPYKFRMTFDAGDSTITAERSGSSHGRVAITDGSRENWSIQPSNRKGINQSFSRDDWCSLLGELMFRIPANEDRASFSPSFRSLISYFVRRESDGGFRRPEANSTLMSAWDQQVAVAYLLGLDWTIARDWELVRQREKSLEALRKAASSGAFGEIIDSSSELRTQLALAEQTTEQLRRVLDQFQVLPEYEELEKEASQLTLQINDLANENTIDEELLQELRRALQIETPPEMSSLIKLYEEAGVTLPEFVNRRFEQVRDFHQSVVSNRHDYLTGEISAAENRLLDRRRTMADLDSRRGDIMRLLKSRGALEQFQRLQEEASRQEVKTETIRQRFQAAEQLEGVKTELEIERNRLVQRLRRDLDEQRIRVTEAITAFQSVSTALYEEAGSLTLRVTNSGLKPEVTIQGQSSRGIQNMQIFCFDLMLVKLCAARRMGPGFLVHDSHLFDGVDERQVAKALQLGAETAEATGWQYIVTLNSDDLPTTFAEDFGIDPYILPVRLTDATADGGLFGFRF